jgi:hypothetical protein
LTLKYTTRTPRRLLDMFGNVVLEIPHEAFDAKLVALKVRPTRP